MCHAGVASDAVKVAEYRSALRLRSSMLQAGSWNGLKGEAAYKNFSRILSKARAALMHLPSAGVFIPPHLADPTTLSPCQSLRGTICPELQH